MGDFADSPKWKLVNDFTIHENRKMKDRPFMRTCVPKTIEVQVTTFEIVRFLVWLSDFDQPKPNGYVDRSYIKFSGDLHDRTVVFNMSDGEIATFEA